MPYLDSRRTDFDAWHQWQILDQRSSQKTFGALAASNHARGPSVPHAFHGTSLREGTHDISVFYRIGGVGGYVADARGLAIEYFGTSEGEETCPQDVGDTIGSHYFLQQGMGWDDPCHSFLARWALEGWMQLFPQPLDKWCPIL